MNIVYYCLLGNLKNKQKTDFKIKHVNEKFH